MRLTIHCMKTVTLDSFHLVTNCLLTKVTVVEDIPDVTVCCVCVKLSLCNVSTFKVSYYSPTTRSY